MLSLTSCSWGLSVDLEHRLPHNPVLSIVEFNHQGLVFGFLCWEGMVRNILSFSFSACLLVFLFLYFLLLASFKSLLWLILPDVYVFCEQKNTVCMLAFVRYFYEAYALCLKTLVHHSPCTLCDPVLRFIWNVVCSYSVLVNFPFSLNYFSKSRGRD